jgi:sugar lactone lactonase YvrE
LAGTAGVAGSTDGTGIEALFNFPQGITTDGTALYVADTINCTIRRVVIATGEVSTMVGTAGVFGSTDGTGPDARFGAPYGITTDGTNLYVADTYNGTIRKVVIFTRVVTTLAGSTMTNGFTDGIGTAAQFNFVTAIATDGVNLYAVDNRSNTIRKIVIETGDVSTLAGTAGVSGSTDGTGSTLFNSPQGIATDGANLYVTDSANLTIRKIVISTGEVSTLAGASGSPDSTDGYGSSARFFSPHGITSDGTTLYVTDMSTIRKIQ